MKKTVIGLCVLAVALCASGCSQQMATGDSHTTGLEVPKTYDAALADEYSELGKKGYQLLDENKIEEAVAEFKKQDALIPAGKWGTYNLACAYGRTGQVEEAFTWLTKAIDNGWDDPDQLSYDGDLESLRADNARFEPLVERTRKTRETREAAFADGLPNYETPPMSFTSIDDLNMWVEDQTKLLRKSRSVWYGWQYTAARMDLEAKRLSALRELKKDDPEFDYGLERVRALSRMRSIYDPWGSLSDGVAKEAEAYLATNPGAEGASEAHYRMGIAALCEHGAMDTENTNWSSAEKTARGHFAQVQAGTKYEGAAAAWQIYCDLAAAGDNPDALMPQIREFADTYRDNEAAMNTAGAFFQEEIVQSLWPIAVDAVDLDNKPVSLDQYKGKVVLVDFWATWCGPCRAELPHVLAAYDEYHKKGFEILSISLDFADRTTPDDYRAWIKDKGMDKWRHVYDQKGWDSPLVDKFFVRGIPNPLLVGRDGSLVGMGEDCRGENLAKTIEAALAKKDV